MSLKHLIRIAVITSGLFGTGMALGTATPAIAESPSYPWCIQGTIYRCRFMTLEQCELTVNFRGSCVTDPNVPRNFGERIRR
jgi:Protein of unknown function (DUF3551)